MFFEVGFSLKAAPQTPDAAIPALTYAVQTS